VTNRRQAGEDPKDGGRNPRAAADRERPGPEPAKPPDSECSSAGEAERERRVRRARFLAELDEARELRKRVTPRRTRAAELHARVLRTFRY